MSSTKPQVRNTGLSQCHQRRTEPRPRVTCKWNLEISVWTYKQTNRHTDWSQYSAPLREQSNKQEMSYSATLLALQAVLDVAYCYMSSRSVVCLSVRVWHMGELCKKWQNWGRCLLRADSWGPSSRVCDGHGRHLVNTNEWSGYVEVAEPIKMPFAGQSWVDPIEACISQRCIWVPLDKYDRSMIRARWRCGLSLPLLWPLVIYSVQFKTAYASFVSNDALSSF